jgi:hypothetical protein
MGILEDAIREHLDLKRSHGADAQEIARQEREALSPAVREPEAAASPAPPAEALAPADGSDPSAPTSAPAAPVEGSDPAPPTPAAHAREPAAPLASDPGQPTESFDPEELFRRQDETAGREADAGDLADDIFADPKPPEPEPDPLEETPDFLQETPEHDRMWFEQKPPKDFDFDG